MNKKSKMLFLLSSLLCLIPIILGLIVYDRLPDMVPSHWNIHGEVDGYMTKGNALFLMPSVLLAIDVVLKTISLFDPKKGVEKNKEMRYIIMFLIPALSLVINLNTILSAYNINVSVPTITFGFIGLLMLLLGNYMPKTSQNYTIGLKLPWTLENDIVWNKTHRLAGITYTIAGLLTLVSILLFKDDTVNFVILMVSVLTASIIPVVYSAIIFEKNKN